MIHSYSNVVLDVLQSLSENGLNVEIITTEARPSSDNMVTNGHRVAAKCKELDLEC